MEQLTMRVHADTLAHFKRWSAEQPRVEGKVVPWSVEARRVLSLGFDCALGQCAHAKKAAARGESLNEALARIAELESSPSTPGDVAFDPFGVGPEEDPALDPRAWVPVPSWRSLDDKGLAAHGCCVEHEQMRSECDKAQLHDEGA